MYIYIYIANKNIDSVKVLRDNVLFLGARETLLEPNTKPCGN